MQDYTDFTLSHPDDSYKNLREKLSLLTIERNLKYFFRPSQNFLSQEIDILKAMSQPEARKEAYFVDSLIFNTTPLNDSRINKDIDQKKLDKISEKFEKILKIYKNLGEKFPKEFNMNFEIFENSKNEKNNFYSPESF